ncbi:hypothetical protein GGI43DRAFT_336661 [Trichoderma evansii]
MILYVLFLPILPLAPALPFLQRHLFAALRHGTMAFADEARNRVHRSITHLYSVREQSRTPLASIWHTSTLDGVDTHTHTHMIQPATAGIFPPLPKLCIGTCTCITSIPSAHLFTLPTLGWDQIAPPPPRTPQNLWHSMTLLVIFYPGLTCLLFLQPADAHQWVLTASLSATGQTVSKRLTATNIDNGASGCSAGDTIIKSIIHVCIPS